MTVKSKKTVCNTYIYIYVLITIMNNFYYFVKLLNKYKFDNKVYINIILIECEEIKKQKYICKEIRQ